MPTTAATATTSDPQAGKTDPSAGWDDACVPGSWRFCELHTILRLPIGIFYAKASRSTLDAPGEPLGGLPVPSRRATGLYRENNGMNWDQIKGNWKQFQGRAKQQWGKLTDDDLTRAEGDRDVLVGRIQERYGIAREEAERQVSEWERRL